MLKTMTSNSGGQISILAIVCLVSASAFSQNITNTIAPNGKFIVKDASHNYLTVSQPTGYLSLNKSLVLPNSTDSILGVIFKGTDRFIHNYSPDGADGYNTFMGINAGNFTMTGGYNTAIGDQSLFSNTDGYGNATIGFQSLRSNTNGSQNTAVGLGSLQNNTIAYNNTAVGYLALNANTTGHDNTASGSISLNCNIAGEYNTASGSSTLYSNTTGNQNTAVGFSSLYFNTGGNMNTASGSSSLYSNTTGTRNTALGNESLRANTVGFENTAVGYQSLYSEAGDGSGLIFCNYNTAVGCQSLFSNTYGGGNTGLGHSAGSTITTGYNLTCLGWNAQPSSGIAIAQITLGNSSVLSLRCAVTNITALSDARDKTNIKELNVGIDFLMKIRPRQFNWDKREWYEDNRSDGSKMKEEPTAGFIAQELDEAQTTGNAEWLNLVLKDNPDKLEATPGNLLPIMVKAIQELKKANDELRAAHGTFENRVRNIQFANEELKDTTVELTGRLTKCERTQDMLVAEIERLKANYVETAKVSLGEK
jgi:hypothetical protein